MLVALKHPHGHEYVLNLDHVLFVEPEPQLVGIVRFQFLNGSAADAVGTISEIQEICAGYPLSECTRTDTGRQILLNLRQVLFVEKDGKLINVLNVLFPHMMGIPISGNLEDFKTASQPEQTTNA